MSLHATEQLGNVRATLLAHLVSLNATLPGGPAFADAEVPRRKARPGTPWVRASIALEPGSYDGHADTTHLAYWTPVVVTIDLFWPFGGADSAKNLYQLDAAASILAAAFRQLHLPLKDYVSDPSSPPTVDSADLQFRQPVVPRTLRDPSGDWQRRQIVVEGRFHLRHSVA